jgi:hypothetical protein
LVTVSSATVSRPFLKMPMMLSGDIDGSWNLLDTSD